MEATQLVQLQNKLIPKIHKLGTYALQQQPYVKGEIKEDGSLVTKIDKYIERELINFIMKRLPESKFVNEEGTRSDKLPPYPANLTWIIDPIDGTLNYVHQSPIFCISVALAYKGEIVMGIIYVPATRETYTATLGGGAFLNEREIQVSQDEDVLKPIAFGQGFWNPSDKYAEEILKNIPNPKRVTGSACFNQCLVAKGACIAASHPNTKIWDIAAGSLIVKEAGGTVTYLNGKEFTLDDSKAPFLASSNSENHHTILETLNLAQR